MEFVAWFRHRLLPTWSIRQITTFLLLVLVLPSSFIFFLCSPDTSVLETLKIQLETQNTQMETQKTEMENQRTEMKNQRTEMETLRNEMENLQLRFNDLTSLHTQATADVFVLAHHLASVVAGPSGENASSLPSWSLVSGETKALVRRLAGHVNPDDDVRGAVHMPSVFSFLPHLLDSPASLRPAFQLSSRRDKVTMVLGVPTVWREERSYLVDMLNNLFYAMAPDEEEDSLVVVFVGETDIINVTKVVKEIQSKFQYQLESGLLEVISPPASYYPDFDNLTPTHGDTPERFRWRTKQALDYAFLMAHAHTRGTFYTQLEDDIVARPEFVTEMLRAEANRTFNGQPWFVFDFCQLGFIGKMFHCSDLPWLVQFLVMFHADQPVDWLLDSLLTTRLCGPTMNASTCLEGKSQLWVRHHVSQFQHVGLYSSLQGKFQPLRISTQWVRRNNQWEPEPPDEEP